MTNPWLNIPANDYNCHMEGVGQAKVLSDLTAHFLDKYKPVSFALLGCATGNGLEHIKPVTQTVFAVDINPEYLQITRERFGKHISGLVICQADIQKEPLPFGEVSLIMAALILEYTDPAKVLPSIAAALASDGALVLVLQRSRTAAFVSKTIYTSREQLSAISHEVDETLVAACLMPLGLHPVSRKEVGLSSGKAFVVLEYIKK